MRFLEQIEVGEVVDLGNCSVTTDDIVAFAATFDPQPFHLDDGLARSHLMGGLAASGWHTAALFQRLYVERFTRDVAVEGSPGVDELRWIKPVRPGDVLTGRVTIMGSAPSLLGPGYGLLRQRCELVDARSDPVFRMTLHVVVRSLTGSTPSRSSA